MYTYVHTLCLQDENRRFRVKFSPSQSTTALEMCKEFAIVFTPLVPIREMGSSCVSTVAAMDTSTRDKAVSTRGMESDSQLLNYEDTQMLDSQVVSALCERPLSQREGLQQSDGSGSRSCDENVPLQPDEAKLIPVPDLGKVCVYMFLLHVCVQWSREVPLASLYNPVEKFPRPPYTATTTGIPIQRLL